MTETAIIQKATERIELTAIKVLQNEMQRDDLKKALKERKEVIATNDAKCKAIEHDLEVNKEEHEALTGGGFVQGIINFKV